MILDLDKGALPAQLTTQVCVIGAGAVGIALAAALVKAGLDVIVLEGGGTALETNSQDLHRGESIGHPFSNVNVGRYRVLGGTTTFWGGQVVPFDAFVTGERPWLGYAAWPIPEGELDQLFRRTFEHIGLAGALADDAEVWKRLRIAPPNFGADLQVVLTRWVRVRNFAKLYGQVLREKSGPKVLLHANAVGLEASIDGRGVQAVEARSLSGRRIRIEAAKVVLANGTLESVRLLKQPLTSGAPAPWATSSWLGAPLIDHLDCIAGDVHILDYERFHQYFDNAYVDGYKYFPKIRMSPATQRADGLVDVAAQFMYRTRLTEHLEYLKLLLRSLREGGAQVPLRAMPAHLLAVAGITLPLAMRYFRDRRSFKPQDAEVALALKCEQLPDSRSRVELADKVDALGMRQVRVNWQIDGRELRSMRVIGQTVKREFEKQALATVKLDPRLEAEDPSFLTEVHDAVHQMGTARMAGNAAQGYVDANLRVHGTDNLFVAGAAVFPSTGFANPTFTAIALALRLSDHLAAELKHG